MSVFVYNTPVNHCCGRPAAECVCHRLTQSELWAENAALPVLDIEAARASYDPAVRAREAGEQRPVVCGPQLPAPARPARPAVTNAALPVLDLESARQGYDPAVLNRKVNADEQAAILLRPELGLRPPRLWW